MFVCLFVFVLFCFCFVFLFCFVFSLVLFCFVLFCFVLVFFFFAFHFPKPLKFVLGLSKWKFSTGQKHFTPGKKSGKLTLPSQKNFPVTPLCDTTGIFLLLCNSNVNAHNKINGSISCLCRRSGILYHIDTIFECLIRNYSFSLFTSSDKNACCRHY